MDSSRLDTRPVGWGAILYPLLQNDQKSTILTLHQACKDSLEPDPRWNLVQQVVYPVFDFIAATIIALKDIILYPITGILRCCCVIISGDVNDLKQGFKEIALMPFAAFALSIYLFALTIMSTWQHKKICSEIRSVILEKAATFSPPRLPDFSNAASITLEQYADTPFEVLVQRMSTEELKRLSTMAKELDEVAVDALRRKPEIEKILARRSLSSEEAKKLNENVSNSASSAPSLSKPESSTSSIPPAPPFTSAALERYRKTTLRPKKNKTETPEETENEDNPSKKEPPRPERSLLDALYDRVTGAKQESTDSTDAEKKTKNTETNAEKKTNKSKHDSDDFSSSDTNVSNGEECEEVDEGKSSAAPQRDNTTLVTNLRKIRAAVQDTLPSSLPEDESAKESKNSKKTAFGGDLKKARQFLKQHPEEAAAIEEEAIKSHNDRLAQDTHSNRRPLPLVPLDKATAHKRANSLGSETSKVVSKNRNNKVTTGKKDK